MMAKEYNKWQTQYLLYEYLSRKLTHDEKRQLIRTLKERNINPDEIDDDVRNFHADMRDKYLRKQKEKGNTDVQM